MINLSEHLKKHWPILVLLLLIIPSVWALLLPGFFESDDGEWMVIRFSAFYQAFVDGQFPVRFLGRLNYGFGYPVANFLYPGFMYFAVPIHVLGLSFVNTIKAVLIFAMAGTAVFSYFWLSKIFDRFSAIIGSLVITYAPYHLFDLYKRGSVGELFAFVWVAFVLWMIEARKLFFVSIGIFLLTISHNTIFLLFTPLLFVYSLIRKTITVREAIISFALGVLMASFFLIPALYELSFTRFSETKISDFSQYFVGLNLIGLSSFVILALSLLVVLKFKKKDPLILLFFSISVLSILFSTKISESLWNIMPSQLIQFPFRLLSCLIFGLGFLAAFVVYHWKKHKAFIFGSVLILAVFSSHNYIAPKKRVLREDSFYSTNEATTTVQDEYMPKWVKDKPRVRYLEKVHIVKGAGEIRDVSFSNSKKAKFIVVAKSDSRIRLNTIYYPGWTAYVNGREVKIDYSNNQGVMEIGVAAGESNVEFVFGETPIRLGADILSLTVFLGLMFLRKKEFKVI